MSTLTRVSPSSSNLHLLNIHPMVNLYKYLSQWSISIAIYRILHGLSKLSIIFQPSFISHLAIYSPWILHHLPTFIVRSPPRTDDLPPAAPSLLGLLPSLEATALVTSTTCPLDKKLSSATCTPGKEAGSGQAVGGSQRYGFHGCFMDA